MLGLATRPACRTARIGERFIQRPRYEQRLITPGKLIAFAGLAALVGIAITYSPDMTRYMRIKSM